nr:EOG090X0FJX [Macrothrix elegans]
MNGEDFELESRLRSLSIGEDDDPSSNREHELAELIANCVADVEPNDAICEDGEKEELEETKDSKLPTSLIVTNLPKSLFYEQDMKTELESLFKSFDPTATFHYLRSFRRARVDFCSHEAASKAQVHLHHTPFGETTMNCFYGHPPNTERNTRQYLQIPPPVRQFLISPPASPPVDWAPIPEGEPVVNFDLLSAIATLGPGDQHELLPASEDKPGIVVHICAEAEGAAKPHRIIQTACPKRD